VKNIHQVVLPILCGVFPFFGPVMLILAEKLMAPLICEL